MDEDYVPRRNLNEVLSIGWRLVDSMDLESLREACKTDLFFLLRFICGLDFIEHDWWLERCDEIQDAPNGFLDLWSREHGKSTIITFGKTIQDILLNPEVTIGIFSHTRPIAKGFLKQVKRELESNVRLLDLFPEIFWRYPKREAPGWSEDGGLYVKRIGNPREATLEAWGIVDGQPTSKHFHIRVYDDLVTKDSVTTEEMRANVLASLELSYNLGTIRGVARMIGTRYHFNDAYATVIRRNTFTPRIRRCTDAEGHSLLFSDEQLRRKRMDMGPVTFSAQMMLDPMADSAISFKREWLRYYRNPRSVVGNIYIMVDPASSKKKGTDYTAMVVVCASADQNIYVMDIVRDRLSLLDRGKTLIDLHRSYSVDRSIFVFYEQYGQQSDIEAIEMMMETEKYRFAVNVIGNRGAAARTSKTERIQWLLPWFENKRIYLPQVLMRQTRDSVMPVDMVAEFVEHEYSVWPNASHEDLLDILSRIRDPEVELKFPKAEAAALSEAPSKGGVAIGTGFVKGWG